MLCYHCTKAASCHTFRTLYTMSKDFSINDCNDYEAMSKYTYRKIAENDDLLHLIYDYFTGQVDGNYTEEQIKSAITAAILDL